MYQYRLNNSYTTYVNSSYYTEARQYCDKIRRRSSASSGVSCKVRPLLRSSGLFFPLKNGTTVMSKHFGSGTVLSTNDGIMSVLFGEKVVRFMFPEVIKSGLLRVA